MENALGFLRSVLLASSILTGVLWSSFLNSHSLIKQSCNDMQMTQGNTVKRMWCMAPSVHHKHTYQNSNAQTTKKQWLSEQYRNSFSFFFFPLHHINTRTKEMHDCAKVLSLTTFIHLYSLMQTYMEMQYSAYSKAKTEYDSKELKSHYLCEHLFLHLNCLRL